MIIISRIHEKYLALFLFLALNQSCISQESLASIEKSRFRAMMDRDTAVLHQLLDEDLVYTHSNGLVESKKDFIDAVWTQKIRYENIELVEQNIVMKGRTAIIAGIVKVKGKFKEKEFELSLRYTDVYIKKKRWKLVAWQSTKI